MSHGKQVRCSEDLKTAGAIEEGNGVENRLVFHSFTSQSCVQQRAWCSTLCCFCTKLYTGMLDVSLCHHLTELNIQGAWCFTVYRYLTQLCDEGTDASLCVVNSQSCTMKC